ncbi:uncharacterized protein LOC134669396 [Cydia fagiglandana]|uniref:uncharacterized protein LOC134669396 n=1 Tax=Cydia fagiglandana TaxID=1458189 RepID=UPI002FEDFB60
MTRRSWNWKEGSSLIGKLGFASLVVPLGRLFTRNLQRAGRLLSEDQPSTRRLMPVSALMDCQWWLENLEKPGRIFQEEPSIFLSTDASDLGWGIQINGKTLEGLWTPAQKLWHVNRKELHTVLIALECCQTTIATKTVMLQADNRTVISYLRNQGGTKSLTLLDLTKKRLMLAQELRVTLVPFYIPGRYNVIADCLSRNKSLPDWHLSQTVTTRVFMKWGIPQIDLFATYQSKVVPVYATMDARDDQALFVNAFSRIWDYELAWVFPPPPLVPRVLQHLNRASGIYLLVVPRWEHVFWRADVRSRALAPPFRIWNLDQHLTDLSTNRTPPDVNNLHLEVWKIRGGVN